MSQFDIVIRNGRIFDPASARDGVGDIGILDGRVAAVGTDLPVEDALEVIEADGRIVAPGLIDFHAHAFVPGLGLGLDLDPVCMASGVTTFVDAGSTGAGNFALLKEFVVDRALVDVKAFVHIASIGLADEAVGESTYLDLHDVDRTAACCRAHPDVVLGVKVRLGRDNVGANGLKPLEMAKAAAKKAGNLPVIIHVTDPVAPYSEILPMLDGGDIVSHYLQAAGQGLLDPDGTVCRAAWEARKRGVVFDVCHGMRHLNFAIARASMAQGFLPDVLSTDLTRNSANGIAKHLPNVMSKFLCLGLTLEQVFRSVGATPARLMGCADEKGTLREGAVADVALFDLREGSFDFVDSQGEVIVGDRRLDPAMTIKSGRIAWERV